MKTSSLSTTHFSLSNLKFTGLLDCLEIHALAQQLKSEQEVSTMQPFKGAVNYYGTIFFSYFSPVIQLLL